MLSAGPIFHDNIELLTATSDLSYFSILLDISLWFVPNVLSLKGYILLYSENFCYVSCSHIELKDRPSLLH